MISIISLNWNTTNLMIQLYNSIAKTVSQDYQFVIVDNGSMRDEVNKLTDYFSQNNKVIIKLLNQNYGFAAGNNVGFSLLNGCDYIFFINSDIVIEEHDWDLRFAEVMKDKVAVAGCSYHPLKWDSNGNFHIQPLSKTPVESESVQGAFFAITKDFSKELIKTDNYIFDEEFKYAQHEETDLCFRCREMGHKVMWLNVGHQHLHNLSATKKHGYHLNDEIRNINEFKANAEKNRQRLISKHSKLLGKI